MSPRPTAHSPRPTAPDLLLGLDQGTTGTTALVVDREAQVLGRGYAAFEQHFPEPGWVEHDPEEIWVSVRSALCQATEGLDPSRFLALGISNQRETTFVWDPDTGRALHRAIVWQDRRTADRCAELKPLEAEIRRATGLPLDPYFSATKLAWLMERLPGPLAFGTADAWLLQRLCGVHATDPSNASRTQLMELRTGRWSEALIRHFGVEGVRLPRIKPSAGLFGRVRGLPELPPGLPVTGVLGDQQAALFGQGCFHPGQAKLTYGTGSFVVMNTGPQVAESRHGLLSTCAWDLNGIPMCGGDRLLAGAHDVPPAAPHMAVGPSPSAMSRTFALEGGAFVAGALVQWLRDGLGLIRKAADIEALAQQVPDSGGVILVPAHAGLGAPHWRPGARGALLGLTRGTTAAHVARAALEGIAHSQADILEAMALDLGRSLTELRVDGGAAANDLLLQIQADLLGIPLLRPRLLETTALGAALIAGLGAGMFKDLKDLAVAYPLERRFEPRKEAAHLSRERWKEAVGRA